MAGFDTTWAAVDAKGHIGLFDSGKVGALCSDAPAVLGPGSIDAAFIEQVRQAWLAQRVPKELRKTQALTAAMSRVPIDGSDQPIPGTYRLQLSRKADPRVGRSETFVSDFTDLFASHQVTLHDAEQADVTDLTSRQAASAMGYFLYSVRIDALPPDWMDTLCFRYEATSAASPMYYRLTGRPHPKVALQMERTDSAPVYDGSFRAAPELTVDDAFPGAALLQPAPVGPPPSSEAPNATRPWWKFWG